MIHYRALKLDSPNDTERTVEASLSSETPVFRPGLGREILSHAPGAIDLSRNPLPVLTSHNRDDTPVGIVENLRIAGGKLRGTLRFGASERALDVWKDVQAGVLRSISIGYSIITAAAKGDDYLVSRWMPYEASLVAVPADPNVGIGRSFSEGNIMETNQDQTQENTSSRSQRRAFAQSEENTRNDMREVLATAEQFKIPSRQVQNFIAEHGVNVQGFRNFVIDNMKASGQMRYESSPEIGLSRREASEFSFIKAIMAQVDSVSKRDAGFELEVSRATAKKLGREPQGIFVPAEVLTAQRDLTVGTPTDGGYLRPTDHFAEGFIDLLRKRCHVFSLGATQLNDLQGNLSIPVQAGASSAFWVNEGSAPTESQPTFGQVTLTPKTVGGFTDYSRKMMLQSSPDIESIIRKDLAQMIAVEVDRVAINGSGVGAEPMGVLKASGIGSVAVGTNGGYATWDHMLQLEESLAIANADTSTMSYMTNQKVRRKLKGTTKVSADAGAGFIWESLSGDDPGWGKVNGYKAVASNNCPSNLTKGTSSGVCSAIILGNWADLLIGQWGALDILVDPYTGGTSGTFRVVALLDCDVAIRRAASFAAMIDVLTA